MIALASVMPRAAAAEADAAPPLPWVDDDVLRNLDALRHAGGAREGGDDEAGLAGLTVREGVPFLGGHAFKTPANASLRF
jgi:hypothetical protein